MSKSGYLVDTDWIIHHINRIEAFRNRLAEARAAGLAVSIVSVAELWEGVYRSSDPRQTEEEIGEFLSGVRVLGMGEETCKVFGRIRCSLRQEKRMIPDLDILIAATALEYNLTLLSNNRRHFENIPGLRLESIP